MAKKVCFLLFVGLLILISLPCTASTAQLDGNGLVQKCKYLFDITGRASPTTNMERLDTGFCAGYIAAVTDVDAMWKVVEGKTSQSTHYCLPADVTNGQVFLVLKKWLDAHPERLHERADSIIHRSLLEAFPCK